MKTEQDYESFIPFPRKDVIQLCLADGQLDPKRAEAFQSFCTILIAFYHFKFHHTLEIIKENYSIFDPNADVYPLYEPTLEQHGHMGQTLVKTFEQTLSQANYRPLPTSILNQALQNRSLINLKTEVDFHDFDQFLCYYRGEVEQTIPIKKLFFWKTQKKIDVLERLVLLIKFKGEGYFKAKDRKSKNKKSEEKRQFIPGKMYVYFYKNIPKYDIDLLFPNIQTSMTLRDRLLLVIPAIGAAIPVILKALPNILLLIAAILIAFNANSALQSIEVEEDQARNIMPVLIATLTLAIALGGFAMKQYSQFKNKKIKFQKDVTDTLFFKNLANHASVFQRFVDIAEEEECKEIILVYYHLLTSVSPLTPKALDDQIEQWLIEKTGYKINFDIQGPLQNLQNICGRPEPTAAITALLKYDRQGHCKVLPLEAANAVLDDIWDQVFSYHHD